VTGEGRRRYHLPAEVSMPEDRLSGEDGRRLAAALLAAIAQAVRESTKDDEKSLRRS
jgi:hypothetical protein